MGGSLKGYKKLSDMLFAKHPSWKSGMLIIHYQKNVRKCLIPQAQDLTLGMQIEDWEWAF
jgi:hypothetical protein